MGLAALAVGLAIGAGAPAFAQKGSVVMYGYPGKHNDGIVTAFQKKYPGIKVKVVSGQGPELFARLIAEKESPQADVIDTGVKEVLERPDLFEPHRSVNHDAFPDWAIVKRGDDVMGYGFTILIQVFAVNVKEMPLATAPKSWKEVLDDKHKGKIMLGNPALSTAGLDSASQIYAMFGEEGIKKLTANAQFAAKTNLVPQSVGRGEVAFGLVEETKTQALAIEGFPVELVYPSDGVTPTCNVLALIRNRPNPENGRLLHDFLTSREGQNINVSTRNRRTPRIDADPPKGLPPMTALKVNQAVAPEKMVTERDHVVALFNKYYANR
jgi:iron(III) transport system substrate-binding protein